MNLAIVEYPVKLVSKDFKKRGLKFTVSQCLLHETGALGKTPGNILLCATVPVCEQKLMHPILCY